MTRATFRFRNGCRDQAACYPCRMLLLLLLFGGLARVGQALEIGERVGPVALLTLDGRSLTMTNYAERRGTVAVFLSARSGVGIPATQTLRELNARLRLRGILFVGIFSNAAETGEEARRFAQREGLLFPIYRDPEQNAAKQFGAKVTPEACLLDSSGALFYRGAVGSTNDSALATAVAAFLDGRPIEASHLPAKGTPIGQPEPKRDVHDPFGSVAFSSELIFEKIPDVPAHHCSTIAEAASGDLLAVWYGGSYESADDQALFLARRKRGGRNWSRPEVLIRDSAQPPGNAVVFRDGRDRIWIVWCRMEASRPLRRGGGWGQTRLLCRTSEDHGVTWSKDELFLGGVREGLRNVPIRLASGEMLLPLGLSFARGKDGGQTWEPMGRASAGSQPTVIERTDGSLLTLLRKGPHILQTESRDGGRTWSDALATGLKNPDAGIAMTRLRNGHLVLVFNDSESARTPLSLARSLDEGGPGSRRWHWNRIRGSILIRA